MGAVLVTMTILGCDASTVGEDARGVAPVSPGRLPPTAGTEPAASRSWQLPSGADVRLRGVTTDARTHEVTARLEIQDAPYAYHLTAVGAGYEIRLVSASGDLFGIRHELGADGEDVIIEFTPVERMRISRRVLSDGRVRETYVHSRAGRREWTHPSATRPSDDFVSEYPAWFPERSTLTDANRLGVWLGEIANGDVLSAIASEAGNEANAIGTSPGWGTARGASARATTTIQSSAGGGTDLERLPGWFWSLCGAAGAGARAKCLYGGGPANAACNYLVGATVGCGVLAVFDQAGWL